MAAQLQCNSVQLEQYKEIMKSDKCSFQTVEDLQSTLNDKGILIDNIYYWLEKGHICVELYSKALQIAGSSDPLQWQYVPHQIPGTVYVVEIAHMVRVSNLDVKGEFNMNKLSKGIEYEILFDIGLNKGAHGWNSPVRFEYEVPTGKGASEQNLSDLIGKGRTQVSIGKFMNSKSGGTVPSVVSFDMCKQLANPWTTGLIMYGVIIKPLFT